MYDYVQLLRRNFKNLKPATAFQVAGLQHQFECRVLGENLPDFDAATFDRIWREPGLDFADGETQGLPIELELVSFLANPNWRGAKAFEARIKDLLDRTMVMDELEELRRLYLQNVFLEADLAITEVRAHLVRDPRWLWVLNPPGVGVLSSAEKIELIRLKYEFFEKIGWLRDATEANPVIHFQMSYLQHPEIALADLLECDMKIAQGSEIFLRLKDVNHFLISFFYNCYKQGRLEILSQFDQEKS